MELPFTGAVILQGGAVLVVLVTVYFILMGKLIPKSTVDDIRKETQAAISREREAIELWKAAYQVSEADRREKEKTLSKAIDGLQTVEFLIRALRLQDVREEEARGTLAVEAKREAPADS